MKYYVQSGQLSYTIAGPHVANHEEAACETVLCMRSQIISMSVVLSNLIIVSERGFDIFTHDLDEDKVFETKYILKKVGILHEH